MKNYEIQLVNTFEAKNPYDALSQMTAWAADSAYTASYRIYDNETGETFWLDAEGMDWNDVEWLDRIDRDDLCLDCIDPAHITCGMEDGCACCETTKEGLTG